MPNEFDPYREALVVEVHTVWPEEYDAWDEAQREHIAQRLHAEPQKCSDLRYERLHTGFARIVTVTPEDLQRLGVG